MEYMGVASGCGCKEVYRFPHYFSRNMPHGMPHLLPQHAHAPHTLTKLTATIVVSLQCMLQNVINYKHITNTSTLHMVYKKLGANTQQHII